MLNWDTSYPLSKFKPCKKIDGDIIDPLSNQQIPKSKFIQVPLINSLVDTFVQLFPYLSIERVWLICKSNTGDIFQGGHSDLSLGGKITKTIVVNLGIKDISGSKGEDNSKETAFDGT